MPLELPYSLKNILLIGFTGLSSSFAIGTAQAYPYAFVSNEITGLTVTTLTGGIPGRITPTVYSETISDTSGFGSSTSQTFSKGATTTGTALTINQAFSGTSAAPSAGFSADGAGSFVGTRANAAISAGDATSGGVSVSNVAEGSGNSLSSGESDANNKATIGLVVVGNGENVVLSFMDLFGLSASTDGLGQTANASIADSFSVINSDGQVVAEYAPADLNRTIGSTNGTSATDTGELSGPFSFTTPILPNGQTFTLSLTSDSAEDFFPGRTTGTPIGEPGSLALLGSALIAMWLIIRRKEGPLRLRKTTVTS